MDQRHLLARLTPSSNRLLLYGATSTALAASVVLNAAQTRSSFYSAAVSIAKSNGAVMILANFGIFLSLLLGMGFQKLFFGSLRPIEVEHLYDRSWYFLTESLLALAMFREDFDTTFVLMFGCLLFLKCFHWIAADRVEWMDQIPPPGPPILFHVRLVALLGPFLFLIDASLLAYAITTVLTTGINGKLLFVNEFTVLLTSWGNVVGRYGVNLWEQWRARKIRHERERVRLAAVAAGEEDVEEDEEEESWEGKSMVVFYIDLVTDFLKLLTYLTFFILILTYYGLPFNILRDVYMTMRSFISRLRTLFQYRAATRNMEARYPDATREEMDRMEDKVCIICRDEMVWQPPAGQEENVPVEGQAGGARRRRARREGERPKKLGCGHVFHMACLKSWLERQQNCPTCRRTVLNQPITAQPTATPVPTPPIPQPTPTAHPNPWGTPAALNPSPQPQPPPHAARFPLAPGGEGGIFAAPVPPPRFAHPGHPVAHGHPLQPFPGPHIQPAGEGIGAPVAGGPAGQNGGLGDGRRPLAGYEIAGFGWGMGVRFGAQLGNPAAGHMPMRPGGEIPPTPTILPRPTENTALPSTGTALPTPTAQMAPATPTASSSASQLPDSSSGLSINSEASSASSSTSPTPTDEKTLSPREVAAQAALRRSARLNPPRSVPYSTEAEDTEVLFVPIPLPPGSTSSNGLLINQPSLAAEVAPSVSPSMPTPSNDPPSRQPTLTPLFPTFPSFRGSPSYTFGFPPSHQPSHFQGSLSVPSMSLPERLTEDELEMMDRLTREAIQERLRFIGRIDGVLSGLREELNRVEERLAPSEGRSKKDEKQREAREVPLPQSLQDGL